jgi:hypothetical protein
VSSGGGRFGARRFLHFGEPSAKINHTAIRFGVIFSAQSLPLFIAKLSDEDLPEQLLFADFFGTAAHLVSCSNQLLNNLKHVSTG